MSKPVDMQALANAVADFDSAYLITISEGDSIHTSVVHPAIEAETVCVPAPSSRVQANTAQRPKVSLVWPPREPNGYSLIVDGASRLEGDNLTVVPTRAILHRPEIMGEPDGDSCVADCIEL